MQVGMVGAGRMGANLARRLMRAGHKCVIHDHQVDAVAAVETDGAVGASSLHALVDALDAPRTVWVMVPEAVTGEVIEELGSLLAPGDVVIDGGNSYYRDDSARASALAVRGIRFLDVGTSGGVHGLERGYCLMIGGDADVVERHDPLFAALAPGADTAPRTAGRTGAPGPSERGYLHCGPPGAGHFVKMVHNGIEYGQMAALAEGLAILRRAGDLDVAEIAEVWRRGSVIGSWLLDLTAAALHADGDLAGYTGQVADSGEGRWTVHTAVDQGVPVPVLTAALYQRFSSRREGEYADKVLSAMRAAFGGHIEGKS